MYKAVYYFHIFLVSLLDAAGEILRSLKKLSFKSKVVFFFFFFFHCDIKTGNRKRGNSLLLVSTTEFLVSWQPQTALNATNTVIYSFVRDMFASQCIELERTHGPISGAASFTCHVGQKNSKLHVVMSFPVDWLRVAVVWRAAAPLHGWWR